MRERPLDGMAEGVIADRMRGGERFGQIVVRDLERRARRVTQTPARQSACSSTRTEFWFEVSPVVFSLLEPISC